MLIIAILLVLAAIVVAVFWSVIYGAKTLLNGVAGVVRAFRRSA